MQAYNEHTNENRFIYVLQKKTVAKTKAVYLNRNMCTKKQVMSWDYINKYASMLLNAMTNPLKTTLWNIYNTSIWHFTGYKDEWL